MSLVLDSSVTLAGLLADEAPPAVRTIFGRITRDGAWVPSLWRLEMANSLQTAVRKGRITELFRDESLIDLAVLPVSIDTETDLHAWGAIVQLAIANRLTTYDAAYLELAIRRNLPLATLDEQLSRAAKATGVKLLGS